MRIIIMVILIIIITIICAKISSLAAPTVD